MASSTRNPSEMYASEAKEKATAGIDKGIDKAKELASNIGEKASDVASNVAQGARRMGENLGEKAQDAMHAVSSGLKQAGDTIREHIPSGSRVAEAFQSTGQYIERGLSTAGEDFIGVVRRNPVPSLLCAAALGFLLARATRS